MNKTDRVKFSTKRRSKRRFKGNQYTNKTKIQQQGVHQNETKATKPIATSCTASDNQQPLSSSKTPTDVPSEHLRTFEQIETNTPKSSDVKIDGYRIID